MPPIQFQPIHASRYLAVKSARPLASFTAIDDDTAGHLLSTTRQWMTLGGLLLGLAAAFMLVMGALWVATMVTSMLGLSQQWLWLAGGLISLAVLAGGAYFFMHPAIDYPALRKKASEMVRRRGSAARVSPDDREAVLVEFVPREHFGKVMLDNADEVGFMVIDEQRREIRFEGDKVRMTIPAESIAMLGVNVDRSNAFYIYYYLTLQVRTPEQMHTLAFRPRRAESNYLKRTYDAVFERQFSTIAGWFPQVDAFEDVRPLRCMAHEGAAA